MGCNSMLLWYNSIVERERKPLDNIYNYSICISCFYEKKKKRKRGKKHEKE